MLPEISWQITGNHWLSIPCIHPDDGSIHLVGLLNRSARGAIEFAGHADFQNAAHTPFLRAELVVDGSAVRLAESGIAWERIGEWLPSYTGASDGVHVRGSICAPLGYSSELPGMFYRLTLENRSGAERRVGVSFAGCLGHRQLRVRSARSFDDAHVVLGGDGDSVVLEGAAAPGLAALAVGGEGLTLETHQSGDARLFSFSKEMVLAAGESGAATLYLAAGAERDGARATLEVLRRRGWRELLTGSTRTLQEMEQSSGVSGVDRLLNRNLLLAYYYGVGRAIDDAQFYMVRSRAPWHPRGITIRDWEALAWILPAVQLADPQLAQEIILRSCELFGYAPGEGLRYMDGAIFEPGFCLEGAASYALAVERYIEDTEDDRIVEEPVLADTLYMSHELLQRHRDPAVPLYATEVLPSGAAAPAAYTVHGNAVVAAALQVLRATLDEKSAADVEQPELVRAALLKRFMVGEGADRTLAGARSANDGEVREVDASASPLWLALYNALPRNDAALLNASGLAQLHTGGQLLQLCALLAGPDPDLALDLLRRAPLFNGFACEELDAGGAARAGATDAALGGLMAWLLWRLGQSRDFPL